MWFQDVKRLMLLYYFRFLYRLRVSTIIFKSGHDKTDTVFFFVKYPSILQDLYEGQEGQRQSARRIRFCSRYRDEIDLPARDKKNK